MEVEQTTPGSDDWEAFIEILKSAELYDWFIKEFGENWQAEKWHYDGWWSEEGAISYRSCNLFGDYAEGYNWSFYKGDYWRTIFVHVMKSHGYVITHNSGDEADGWFRMALPNNNFKIS